MTDTIAQFREAFENESSLNARLMHHLRDIATDMSHAAYHETTEDSHIYESSTGGQRFCGPCHAWRVLNGTPNLWEPTPKMLQEALNGIEPWLTADIPTSGPDQRHLATLAAAVRLKYTVESP